MEGDLYVVGAPVLISGAPVFTAAAQRLPLNHLALVAPEACEPGFHRSVATGEMVLSRLLLPPAHCTDCRLGHTSQFFCDRGLFACH